jgi:hypothetical protein
MNCSTYRKTGLIRNVQASGIDAEFLCFAGTSNSALTHACASFSFIPSNMQSDRGFDKDTATTTWTEATTTSLDMK